MDKEEKNRKARKLFTKAEDEKLKSLVAQFGRKNWEYISSLIPGRTGRQCRERYRNYLIPGGFYGKWTDEEDVLLYHKFKEIGSHWSKMAKYFKGRSANSIKNRWNCVVSKKQNSLESPVEAKRESTKKEKVKLVKAFPKAITKEDKILNSFDDSKETNSLCGLQIWEYNFDEISLFSSLDYDLFQ